MPNTICVLSDRLEQLVGTDVYATSVSDIQTRAIPVTRTFTSLPVGPLTGSENVGEYCLVGSVTASVDAGLYVVRLGGADKVLERVKDFQVGTPVLTPVAVLDLSTGDVYSLSPETLGTKSTIGTGNLAVAKISSSTVTSLVTYADVYITDLVDATEAGVRYLVGGTDSAERGVWAGKGGGNAAERTTDTDFVFDNLLVLILSTGAQYLITTTPVDKKPTDAGYTADVTLKYNVAMEYTRRVNHQVAHVVPFLSTLDVAELRVRLGVATITTRPVLVLVVADNPAHNGVYTVDEGAANPFVRPSWWGGTDPELGTKAGPDDMYNTVVCDMQSTRYYENVATGRIDADPSLWVITLKPNTANRVYVTAVFSEDTVPATRSLPEFVMNTKLAPDYAIIHDITTTPATYRIFTPPSFTTEWTVDDRRANHNYVFVNIYDHGTFAAGDSYGFTKDSSPALIAVNVNKESMLHCERAIVYSTDESDSVSSGALTVRGGVGVVGDVHANSLFADCDVRLKRDIRRIEGGSALGMVGALGAYEYSYRGGGGNSKRRRMGVMAHEVRSVAPGATKVTDTGHLAVDTQQLIPLLVASVNELQARLGLVEGAAGR